MHQQLFAMMHGTFCFMAFNGYGWYLSSTAALLYLSWLIHNFVAWLKVRPFFLEPRSMFRPWVGRWVARIYLVLLALSAGPILLQIVDNFLFFNNINDRYKYVRPYEPLMRYAMIRTQSPARTMLTASVGIPSGYSLASPSSTSSANATAPGPSNSSDARLASASY
jgi:hypothetical protein